MTARRLAVIMDPIESINIKKDSTFAMLLEAQRRGYRLYYAVGIDISISDGVAYAVACRIQVFDSKDKWFEKDRSEQIDLGAMDVVLMRKDPPFNMDYIYLTYALDLAQAAGAMVINNPLGLRQLNEKLSITHFPECCVPTLVTRSAEALRAFTLEHNKAVVKPLDGMGGQAIFQLNTGDPNLNVILENATKEGTELVMAQRYVEEIKAGDKRILLINGEPVRYALARIPGADDFRGNLAKGGHGVAVELSDRDRWICTQVAPLLKELGILFAGIDVIGDYLTEINVTSPTCIRELDAAHGLNIAGDLFDAVEQLIE